MGLTALLTAVGFATWRVYSKGQDAKQAREDAEKALADLTARKSAVEATLNRLNTEQGIDAEIRNRYQLVKPGEEQIVLIQSQQKANASSSTESKGMWETFIGWFSH